MHNRRRKGMVWVKSRSRHYSRVRARYYYESSRADGDGIDASLRIRDAVERCNEALIVKAPAPIPTRLVCSAWSCLALIDLFI